MRVLVTLLHIHPMIPLVQALAEAGHEVAFACSSSSCQIVKGLGYQCFVAGTDMLELMPQIMAVPEAEREDWVLKNIFAGELPRRIVPDLLEICRSWKPDVVVRDYSEVGGSIAAEMLGLPHASMEIGAFLPLPIAAQMFAPGLGALRSEFGLPPDPQLEAIFRYLHLSFVPPSFHDPSFPMPPTTHALRTVTFDRSYEAELPDWVDLLPDLPIVYATLGLGFSNDRLFAGATGLFRAIIEALRDEPLNLIVTIGPERDPEEFGPQPENVRVARYVPQSLILPRCSVVISHGGWSTVMGALSHGLPQVLIPISADQPLNARRCAEMGVGVALDPSGLTPERIRDAVRTVMREPSFREKAMGVRAEIESLPGVEHAVRLLERLAEERRPLPGRS